MRRERAAFGKGRALQWGALGTGALGLGFWLLGASVSPARASFSYLAAYAFGLSLALGALLCVAIAHLAGARWFVVLRRLAEAMAATLPVFALLFLPLLPGLQALYPWMRPEAALTPEVGEWAERTRGYLNTPFFLVRAAIYFVVWVSAAEWLRAWSVRQDERGGDEIPRLRALSTAVLPAVALTLTFAAMDWLMSLVPVWASAAWGIYYFAGGVVGALGLLAVLGFVRWRSGEPGGASSASHFHALGKLLLAAVLFWAYIAYSQYLIVWIANLPREVVWYVPRTRTSWRWVGVALLAGHFALPALALLSWRLKRRAAALAALGAWVVAMHYLDLYWVVLPALHPEGFRPHWLDLAALFGVGGVATGFGVWRLRSAPAVPVGDPGLEHSLEYTTR